MTEQVIGIDVGKAKLDVGLSTEKRVRVWANDADGRAELSEWVVAQAVSLSGGGSFGWIRGRAGQ
jgi:hypothetical protein